MQDKILFKDKFQQICLTAEKFKIFSDKQTDKIRYFLTHCVYPNSF